MYALLATTMTAMMRASERKVSDARRAASHFVTPDITGLS
jgi:hypothetical protein